MGLALSLPSQYLPFLSEPFGAPQTVTRPSESLGAVLSPSQIRTLMDCSARWWYKYGLQIPEPPNANLAIGNAVHAAIAYNFEQKIASGADRPIAEVLEHLEEDWYVAIEDVEFRDDEDPAQLAGQARGLVELYLRDAAPAIQPAAVELKVEGAIAGVQVQGRLDILESNGRIRDLKTSSRKSAAVTNEQRFQLATYVPFAAGSTGEVVIDQLVKTKAPQLVQLEHTVSRADIAATERMYPHAQAFARAGNYMPNRTSTLCSRKNCAYWSQCQTDFGGRVSES